MKHVYPHQGLTAAQVLASRERHGANVLTPPEREPLWKKFLQKFRDPLIIILLIAGLLSIGIACYEYFALGEGGRVFFEPVGIFVAILLATGLSFWFENKAEGEFALLNQVNDEEPVQVVRDGGRTEVPRRDVVVGDIVVLSTGNEVPADAELLEAVSLSVNESSLTGEPLCRKTVVETEFDSEATFPSNHVMRGTTVMEGHGLCRVYAVGDHTENGKVFQAAQIDDSVKTPLTEQLEHLARWITLGAYTFAALIVAAKLLVHFRWQPEALLLLLPVGLLLWLVADRFPRWSRPVCAASATAAMALFVAIVVGLHAWLLPAEPLGVLMSYTLGTLMIAVTLIVVAVPEGLPMAVALALAGSMRRMLKTNNLVRKMHACETMGATTVICTDKTGTLTQNQMQVDTPCFDSLPEGRLDGSLRSRTVAEGIAANSTASLDLSEARPRALGNPTEGALLLWLAAQGVDYRPLREASPALEELPFSTERKYMATVVRSALTGRRRLYVKGAPEIVFSLCAEAAEAGRKATLDSRLLDFQNKAMRTLGFAYKDLTDEEPAFDSRKVLAQGLSFLGFVAIADPVRADVPPAVQQCLQAGVQIKIVTGDTPGTAREIGRQIGIWTAADSDRNLITGPEFAALTDDELKARIMDIKIISRARPMDKKRLVETLQQLGQVVAVTGDGTNDAPALKAAHVGLSMGDGTSVAKEASDITIVDNSFASITRAVMWGRSLYQNIQRFIAFQLTVNVAACLIVFLGALIGEKSPLTVTQMLWVNLVMDTFAAMGLASLPPSEAVMADRPRRREAFIITPPMGRMIVSTGLLLTALLVGMLFVLLRYDISSVGQFFSLPELVPAATQTLSPYEMSVYFTFFVMFLFWHLFNAKAYHTGRSAFHLKGCQGFLITLLIILVGQILIVCIGGPMFSVSPLSLADWLLIVASTSLVLWLGELSRLVR